MTYNDRYHPYNTSNISTSHTHSITLTPPPITTQRLFNQIYDDLMKNSTKEPEMTTLEKVRKERQEALERKQIEAMYADYDELDLDLLADGTVYRFEWVKNDKTYTYAALKADDRWYVTGGSAPNGLPTEDFVAWLIGKKVASVALELLEPAS